MHALLVCMPIFWLHPSTQKSSHTRLITEVIKQLITNDVSVTWLSSGKLIALYSQWTNSDVGLLAQVVFVC